MVGAICKYARKRPSKSSKTKSSSADDNLESVPLETVTSVPSSPTEMTTFYPVMFYICLSTAHVINSLFRKLRLLKPFPLQLINYTRVPRKYQIFSVNLK